MTTPPAPTARRSNAQYRWTREKIHAFILALARGRSVAAAARSVGMGRQSAYKLRDRLGPDFAELWAEGRARGAQGGDLRAHPRRAHPQPLPQAGGGREAHPQPLPQAGGEQQVSHSPPACGRGQGWASQKRPQGDTQGDTRSAQGDTQGDTFPPQGDTFHYKATPKATVSAPN